MLHTNTRTTLSPFLISMQLWEVVLTTAAPQEWCQQSMVRPGFFSSLTQTLQKAVDMDQRPVASSDKEKRYHWNWLQHRAARSPLCLPAGIQIWLSSCIDADLGTINSATNAPTPAPIYPRLFLGVARLRFDAELLRHQWPRRAVKLCSLPKTSSPHLSQNSRYSIPL